MPAMFYSDERSAGAPSVPYERWDATKHYLTHYSNLLTLQFIARSSKDRREQAQARKEMEIAERKLAFWKRHPRYDHAKVLAGIQELKSMWRTAA